MGEQLVPHLDDLPFGFVGKGEQSSLKVLLALNRKVQDAHIVLVEEPENHLSFTNLNQLVSKIGEKCKDKQVFITTHSSYVLNKLGLDSLVLLTPTTGLRLTDLPQARSTTSRSCLATTPCGWCSRRRSSSSRAHLTN